MKQLKTFLLLTFISVIVASCADGERMRQQLAYMQMCNQADTVFSARWLPTVDTLVTYFDSHGTPNERLMAHYLQGRVYHDMGEAPQAIDCYQQAVSQVDSTSADCDLRTLMVVYGQMSELFHNQFLPDDEIDALKSMAKIARKNKDILSEIISTGRLIGPYYLKSDTDSVLIVEKLTREMSLQHGYKEFAGQAVSASISISLNRKNLQEANQLLNIYRNESGLFDSNGETMRGSAYYVGKGTYLTLVGELDSAQFYFNKAVNCGQYEGGYKGLLSVYEKKHLPDSIAKYARLFATANDSSYLHVNQEVVHRISAINNYSRQQKIAEEQAERARKANIQKTILIGIIILLITASFLTFRYLKKRAKEKYLKLSIAYDKSKADLTAAIDRQRLLRYDYEEALKGKDAERQQQLFQIQEDIQQKESEILLLQKKIETLETQLQHFSSAEMEKDFKKSRIYKLFNERKKPLYINQRPSEEDWDELSELFRIHFVRFNTFISYEHRLSLPQYRYCILLRLGFDNFEIGILMDKDKDQRYHLRKFICESLFGKSVDIKMFDSLLKEHF